MSTQPLARKLRARKLSILIKDARSVARRSPAECAEALAIPVEVYQGYEDGLGAPSLPELELLAAFFDIPLEHFWSNQTVDTSEPRQGTGPLPSNAGRLLQIRQRVLGALLHQARENSGRSIDSVAAQAGLETHLIEGYEQGNTPIPLPDLESIANALQVPLTMFYDEAGPIGKWRQQRERVSQFLALQPELQTFLTLPVNRPYIELAQRLSQLPAERLRSIAEALLEITY